MDVSISVDFGQGYRVSLSPHDARKLYDQLRHLFETQPYASFSGNTPAPLWPLNANGSLGNGTSGALWNAAGMVTSSSLPGEPEMPGQPYGNYFTAKVSEETVDKMASELEAKVKAEMDKQGLSDESCDTAEEINRELDKITVGDDICSCGTLERCTLGSHSDEVPF